MAALRSCDVKRAAHALSPFATRRRSKSHARVMSMLSRPLKLDAHAAWTSGAATARSSSATGSGGGPAFCRSRHAHSLRISASASSSALHMNRGFSKTWGFGVGGGAATGGAPKTSGGGGRSS